MKASDIIGCRNFPCDDVKHENYIVPEIDINPESVSIVMISEAAPAGMQKSIC